MDDFDYIVMSIVRSILQLIEVSYVPSFGLLNEPFDLTIPSLELTVAPSLSMLRNFSLKPSFLLKELKHTHNYM